MDIKRGQIVTLKPARLEAGEENLPHVALEDSFAGTVKVRVVKDFPALRIKPINIWRADWIAGST